MYIMTKIIIIMLFLRAPCTLQTLGVFVTALLLVPSANGAAVGLERTQVGGHYHSQVRLVLLLTV